MSNPYNLWLAGMVMVTSFVFAGVIWFLAFGMDMTQDEFAKAGVYDVGEDWQHANDADWMVNLLYAIVYLLPMLGIGNFILNIIRKQRYDALQAQYGGLYP